MLKGFIKKITDGNDLTAKEMREAMEIIMSGRGNEIQMAGFLTALKMKGETAEEITVAAEVMRSKAVKVEVSSETILDTCGSGGDGKGSINISTAVAVVAAASGITVAKHGNKSITSKSGSADVLKELGVNTEAPPETVARCIEKTGIGFIFAPGYHKAMEYIMPVRKGLGVRTIFNILGPIVNPAMHTNHMMGVFDIAFVEKLIRVFKGLGMKHAAVVHGAGGLDEISPEGDTLVAELKNGEIKEYNIRPEDYGIKPARIEDIKGGDPLHNAKITNDIFDGKEKGCFYDTVLLNAGAAIYIGDGAEDIKEGVAKAKEIIESGKAADKLKEFIEWSNK